jgi:proteasome lid subunit RPN8/RPN11
MDESGFKVSRTVRMENTRRGETNYEFVIHADELLRVMKEARKEGLDIIGFYHSHPDHPARPSEKDKKWGGETWPGVAHLILAVAKGEPEEAKAFVFEPEAGAFREIQVHSASAAL